MRAYRKERIENAIALFVHEHYQKTGKPLSQTKLWKYLSYFEINVIRETGIPPLELDYQAWEHGPVPYKLRQAIIDGGYSNEYVSVTQEEIKGKKHICFMPRNEYELDYFSEFELEQMFMLIEIFADKFVTSEDMSESSHWDFPSWRKGWKNRGGKKAGNMKLEDELGDFREKDSESLTVQEENFLAHEVIQR